MSDLPADLTAALDDLLESARPSQLARIVERLVARYRDGVAAGSALTEAEAIAYAAYRMPATFGAVRTVAAALREVDPGGAPASVLDVGGGTGGASWALVDAFPGVATVTVIERDVAMAAVGRRLAARAQSPAVRDADWLGWDATSAAFPSADLTVLAYSLGELAEAARAAVVRRIAATSGTVVVVEPGTPRGYRTVLAARDELIAAGLRVVAPCPHSSACPLQATSDWCHFAARVDRSAVHRRAKRGVLGYEDEKFSYVVATADDIAPAPGRLIRHPQHRKGHTILQVCAAEGAVVTTTVAKSHGPPYRAARTAAWGDRWPRQV